MLTNVPSGRFTITATLAGFSTQRLDLTLGERPVGVTFRLKVGQIAETVRVTGETPIVDTQSTTRTFRFANDDVDAPRPAEAEHKFVAPSQNVINLQKRAAGVLPVRVDVPKAGTSHRFVRPLVVDQETVVALRYKSR